jgi:hypothetical protein
MDVARGLCTGGTTCSVYFAMGAGKVDAEMYFSSGPSPLSASGTCQVPYITCQKVAIGTASGGIALSYNLSGPSISVFEVI